VKERITKGTKVARVEVDGIPIKMMHHSQTVPCHIGAVWLDLFTHILMGGDPTIAMPQLVQKKLSTSRIDSKMVKYDVGITLFEYFKSKERRWRRQR
jgi:hypothetical protein